MPNYLSLNLSSGQHEWFSQAMLSRTSLVHPASGTPIENVNRLALVRVYHGHLLDRKAQPLPDFTARFNLLSPPSDKGFNLTLVFPQLRRNQANERSNGATLQYIWQEQQNHPAIFIKTKFDVDLPGGKTSWTEYDEIFADKLPEQCHASCKSMPGIEAQLERAYTTMMALCNRNPQELTENERA